MSPVHFYGTTEETYVVGASGKIWCVQSPDLQSEPREVTELPASAKPIARGDVGEIEIPAHRLE